MELQHQAVYVSMSPEGLVYVLYTNCSMIPTNRTLCDTRLINNQRHTVHGMVSIPGRDVSAGNRPSLPKSQTLSSIKEAAHIYEY